MEWGLRVVQIPIAIGKSKSTATGWMIGAGDDALFSSIRGSSTGWEQGQRKRRNCLVRNDRGNRQYLRDKLRGDGLVER